MSERTSKRELLHLVATRAHVDLATTERVYEALLVEVVAQVRTGKEVQFFGYGRFYPQVHKGHHVQFGAKGQGRLPDYPVLKFSASQHVNKFLGLDDDTARKTRVPGTCRLLNGLTEVQA